MQVTFAKSPYMSARTPVGPRHPAAAVDDIRTHPAPAVDADTSRISPASRSASSLRAAISQAQDELARKSPGELESLARRTQDRILTRDWVGSANDLAKEAPAGANEHRLEITRSATAFVQRLTSSRPVGNAQDNPFYGMTRADLAAIAYDESGSFTTNERRAAFNEAGRQAGEWSAKVCAQGSGPQARSGDITDFLREILAYYEALPAVEQAATPTGYIDRLRKAVVGSEHDHPGPAVTSADVGRAHAMDVQD
jgi:hypothetical protein